MNTPWGPSDHQTHVAPGIVFHSTPSHGGYHLDAKRNAQVLAKFPGFRTFCGSVGWYEEDCDWAAVALTFPDLFTAENLAHAEGNRPHTLADHDEDGTSGQDRKHYTDTQDRKHYT